MPYCLCTQNKQTPTPLVSSDWSEFEPEPKTKVNDDDDDDDDDERLIDQP